MLIICVIAYYLCIIKWWIAKKSEERRLCYNIRNVTSQPTHVRHHCHTQYLH